MSIITLIPSSTTVQSNLRIFRHFDFLFSIPISFRFVPISYNFMSLPNLFIVDFPCNPLVAYNCPPYPISHSIPVHNILSLTNLLCSTTVLRQQQLDVNLITPPSSTRMATLHCPQGCLKWCSYHSPLGVTKDWCPGLPVPSILNDITCYSGPRACVLTYVGISYFLSSPILFRCTTRSYKYAGTPRIFSPLPRPGWNYGDILLVSQGCPYWNHWPGVGPFSCAPSLHVPHSICHTAWIPFRLIGSWKIWSHPCVCWRREEVLSEVLSRREVEEGLISPSPSAERQREGE